MIEAAQEDKSLRVIPASVILARIKIGKTIKYDHVRIKGDLEISSLNLEPDEKTGKYPIDSIIEIKDSIFDGTVDFNRSLFKNAVDFSNTEFAESAIFLGSIFKQSAKFTGSRFNRRALFYYSQFNGITDFSSAQFNKLAWFYGSEFKGWTFFNDSEFKKSALFCRSKFLAHKNSSDTSDSGIKAKSVSFCDSKFSELADFEDSMFEIDAVFVRTRFDGIANFTSSTFHKKLDLSGSNIFTMVLDNAVFGEDSTILLKYSVFNRLEVPWKLIWSKLEIKQEGDDSKEDDKPKNDGSVYLALVKNYENLEWFDDADACYDQYMKKKSASIKLMEEPVKKLQHCCVSFWLYGFRVHPEYPLLAMLIIFTFSIPVYFFSGQASSPHEAFEISSRMLIGMPMRSSTDLTGLCNIWSIGERISGWILMSSFLVVLARKVLR